MTGTSTLPIPVEQATSNDHDGVMHWYCCDPDLSYCLLDISDEAECPDECGCQPCVVCEDMADEPCPRDCGWPS